MDLIEEVEIMQKHNAKISELLTACTKEMIRQADILGVDRNLFMRICVDSMWTAIMFGDYSEYNLEEPK